MAAFFPGDDEQARFRALYKEYRPPDDTSVDIGGHNFLVLPQMLTLFEVPEIRLQEPERDSDNPYVRADSRLERLRDGYVLDAVDFIVEQIEQDYALNPKSDLGALSSAAAETSEKIRERPLEGLKTYFLWGASAALTYAPEMANLEMLHELMGDLRIGRSGFRPEGGRRRAVERMASLPDWQDVVEDFEDEHSALAATGRNVVPNAFAPSMLYEISEPTDLVAYLYSAPLVSREAYEEVKGRLSGKTGELGRQALDSLDAIADAVAYQRRRKGPEAVAALERNVAAVSFDMGYARWVAEDFLENDAHLSRLS